MVVKNFAEVLAQKSVRLTLLSVTVLSVLFVVWTYHGPSSDAKPSVLQVYQSSQPVSAGVHEPLPRYTEFNLGSKLHHVLATFPAKIC